MRLLLAIFDGLTVGFLASVLAILFADKRLTQRGITIIGGRRHTLAFQYGLLIGGPVGFALGAPVFWFLAIGTAGIVGTVLVALFTAAGGFLAMSIPVFAIARRRAERTNIQRYMHTGPTGVFLQVALPAGIVAAIVGFYLGWIGSAA